jgi:hypothetical protein
MRFFLALEEKPPWLMPGKTFHANPLTIARSRSSDGVMSSAVTGTNFFSSLPAKEIDIFHLNAIIITSVFRENDYANFFCDFVQELKKQKVTLSKKDEFELLSLFEDQKTQATALRQEIEKTDKEIDKMVYELYRLTKEEIRIIEGA